MLTRAVIRNFRCLADVDLTFEPLTILVGPNASGKSAMIAALGAPAIDGPDYWRGNTSEPVEFRFAFDDGRMMAPHQRKPLVQPFHLDIEKLRSGNQVAEAPSLAPDGSNLANVFATLTRAQQDQLVARFRELVPMYGDIVARPQHAGYHRLVFQDKWTPTLWYEPKSVSDGTILLLAFLVLQYQAHRPEMICIEEPERGFHPYLLGEVVQFLRSLATGAMAGRPTQVVLATHSAELLAFAKPEEVRFLSRRESDGTTQVEVAPTQSADWEKAVREYQGSLGGLWLSGSLGGVPGG